MSVPRTKYATVIFMDSMHSRPSVRRRAAHFVRTKPLGSIGLLIVFLILVAAVFADFLAPYDPYSINAANRLRPPSEAYLLGTDNFGRDILSRIIFGARISLFVGVTATAIDGVIALLLGVFSGYRGGKLDMAIQRVIDIMMAIPSLLLALALVAALGASITNVIIAIAISGIAGATRVIRGATLSVREMDYVLAARTVGCRDVGIMLKHVVPNVMAPFLILVTARVGSAILIEASLSFLGLGTPEPEPSWGLMLAGPAARFAQVAPWMGLFPGIVLSLAVLGFNLFGDALRDAWDPKLRGA